ncbi:MAG: SdiA-regulated domain-containing protein [Kiritimatiellae bacterium]|nr:SdiA-regulated domain-containing protein [Kiritimatiellia bacterium]MDD5522188.1 SdiA-regulated domain-containing protein [Kiritimatiellia bacterium]
MRIESKMFNISVFLMLFALTLITIQADNTNVSTGSVKGPDKVGLEHYVLKMGPARIDGAVNCSGITFNPQTKTIFMVANSPAEIYELGLDGKTRRTIALHGFDDTEDVVFVEGNVFAVVEEKRRTLCLVDITLNAASVEYSNVVKFLVDTDEAGNSGLEGVAYDAVHERFFVVKEKHPRRIYSFLCADVYSQRRVVNNLWDIDRKNLGCKDLSGVHYHAGTGHLLILSDKSKCVVETTLDGKEISRLLLVAGSAGMTEDAPQPEGITMDDTGNIYICSEPNLVYIFSKLPR